VLCGVYQARLAAAAQQVTCVTLAALSLSNLFREFSMRKQG
jgi:hypothetical protein